MTKTVELVGEGVEHLDEKGGGLVAAVWSKAEVFDDRDQELGRHALDVDGQREVLQVARVEQHYLGQLVEHLRWVGVPVRVQVRVRRRVRDQLVQCAVGQWSADHPHHHQEEFWL